MDHVDQILAQWRREMPGLDVAPMAITGRVKRLALFFSREMEETWGEFDLHQASFDVLATLRRSGSPYELSPSELISSTMVTSGTMTNRIDQLEAAGLVTRGQSADDKRSLRVRLTEKGRVVIEAAMKEHVKTLQQLTSGLGPKERKVFVGLLKKMLEGFEGEGGT